MVDRRELLDHLDWLLRPPSVDGLFIDQCIEAIDLVAADRGDQTIEIARERCTASEAVEFWELEDFVAEVRRDGDESSPET